MKETEATPDPRVRLGVDRVLEPANALPQGAATLDTAGPLRAVEIELAVEGLYIGSTSFENLRERAGGDPDGIGERVIEIVAERGKMHNPETNTGGVMVGTVTAVGEQAAEPPELGTRVVPMASLAILPLRLDAVTRVDPHSPYIEVKGTAYVRSPCATLPADIPDMTAIDILDVCPAASQTRLVLPHSGTVCVLGVGNAGKLALASAREELNDGQVVAIDVDAAAVETAVKHGLCDVGVVADLRDPLATLEAARAAGVDAADLTIVTVNAGGCEQAAVLLTAEGGETFFFSMATSFPAAALAGDGYGSSARLLMASTYSPDLGAYALDLYRRSPAVQQAFAK